MPFGFEDPEIHNVVELTAEAEGDFYAARPWLTLKLKGRHSSYDHRTEECEIAIYFAERHDLALAQRLAAAINAALVEEPEP